MSRILKYLAITAGIFLIFISAGTFFVESHLFKDWLRRFVMASAKDFMRGELSIGRLQGNLFSRLELSQVLIKSLDDTVLFAPKISIHFQPRPLLRRQILLDSIRIDSLYVFARQLSDSTWNFSNLLGSDTSAFSWVVRSERTELRGCRLVVRPLETSPLLPQTIEALNARLAWTYADSAQDLHLQEFNLRTYAPDFVLKELTFQLRHRRNELQLQNLVIRTAQNRFDGSGTLYAATPGPSSPVRKASAKLSSAPLHFEEFNFVLPFLRIHGNPDFDVSTRLRGDSLRFRLAIQEREQHLQLQGHLSHWKKEPRYAVTGTLSNFDASTWVQNPKWACLINGKFEVEGRGFFQRSMALRGSAEAQDCILMQRKVQRIAWRGDYLAGILQSQFEIESDLGEASVQAALGDSLHGQNFSVHANFKRLRIPPLSFGDTLQTILNLGLSAQGRGLHPDTLQAKVQLALGPSIFAGVPIDTLWGGGEVHHKRIEIDTLNLLSALGDFHLGGNFNRVSSWALRFDGQVGDLRKLQELRLITADTLAAHGNFSGEIRGFSDSLNAKSDFALEGLHYNTLTVDTLIGNVFLHRQNGHWQGRTHVHGENAQTAGLELDNRFDLRAGFIDSLIDVRMDFAQGDSLTGRLDAFIALADSLQNVAITDLDFRFKEQAWSSAADTISLTLGDSFYKLQNLQLFSGKQAIRAEGVWDLNSELNLHCEVDSLDVRAWSELFEVPMPLTGGFNARVRVQGTAQSPLMNGDFLIHEGRVDRVPYEYLKAQFNYHNERLAWQASLKTKHSNEIISDGFVPLNLSLNNSGERLLPDDSMRVVLNIPAFDLAALKYQIPDLQEASGKLEARVTIENTPSDPRVQGALRVQQGKLEAPRYGMRFAGIEVDAAMDDRRISLNQLLLKRDKGSLTISGYADYEKHGVDSEITNLEIKLKASNLLLTNHRALDLLVDGEVGLAGTLQQPHFQGVMKVVRARVDLPTFSEAYDEYESEAQTEAPMLIAALAEYDSTTTQALAQEKPHQASEIFQNLRGNLKVELLRNTWLRSPALNVEISGEVNVVKDGPDLEIFGPIEVERGTYVLPGISKSFDVESGTITFQGGADYNPELDLYADYVFRRPDREKKTLRAHITDKAASPKFAFTMVEDNNKEVTENDALSYLIFGLSVEELTQQSTTADNTNGTKEKNTVASDAVTGMLSDRLSRHLGQELGVDVLQLRGNQNFDELSFLVGKYLTNDLFVSYEDDLGGQRDSNQLYSTITLEYEVARFLFLQLVKGDTKTTGFDAIIKIQK